MTYLFYVHNILPEWRLAIRKGHAMPVQTSESQWNFTRARLAEETNADVRRTVDVQGWCLFKIGGSFDQIEAELKSFGQAAQD